MSFILCIWIDASADDVRPDSSKPIKLYDYLTKAQQDINTNDTLGDVKKKFPRADFLRYTPARKYSDTIIYKISGQGVSGELLVNFFDERAKFQRDLDEFKSDPYSPLTTFTPDSYATEKQKNQKRFAEKKVSMLDDDALTVISVKLLPSSEPSGEHSKQSPIDPEEYIKKNGYQSIKVLENNKGAWYSSTIRLSGSEIIPYENAIEKLPKHIEVQKSCDFTKGLAKARIIEATGVPVDVAVVNFGFAGSTIACVLKYMNGGNIGTQIIYTKAAKGSMYFLFIAN